MKIDGPFMPSWAMPPLRPGAWQLSATMALYTGGQLGSVLPTGVGSGARTAAGYCHRYCRGFPRNPMHLAYQAWDLQKFSDGNFCLGIGSQVKAHIEKRFGVDSVRPPRACENTYRP